MDTKKKLSADGETCLALMKMEGIEFTEDELELFRRLDDGEITREEYHQIISKG